MKFKNVLSLFLCLLMIFTVGSSMAVSSAAHEYSSSSISTCVNNAANSALSISTQKTASFWNGFVTTIGVLTGIYAFQNLIRIFWMAARFF